MAYPDGFKYTKDHEWIDVSADPAHVGITEYAEKQLGDVVYIELPDAGRTLKQGESFGTIESVKAVSELYAPVSGEVIEINSAVKDKPELVNKDPHGTWLIALRLADPAEAGSLLNAAQYADLVK
jgi:glycine cleavage system H protein